MSSPTSFRSIGTRVYVFFLYLWQCAFYVCASLRGVHEITSTTCLRRNYARMHRFMCATANAHTNTHTHVRYLFAGQKTSCFTCPPFSISFLFSFSLLLFVNKKHARSCSSYFSGLNTYNTQILSRKLIEPLFLVCFVKSIIGNVPSNKVEYP